MSNLKVAVIGLDSSHSIQFIQRMQAPDCPANLKVDELRAVTCMRFSTPFQSEEGLNERQKQLEGWGVKVTSNFDEAVADCDAIMIVINDPAYHLEYVKKCASLGKPIFLDKPLADTITNGKAIQEIVDSKKLKLFSCSTLRFGSQIEKACKDTPNPLFANIFGPISSAPAGSSMVWYGVHSFEPLQRILGNGAQKVLVKKDNVGAVAQVTYSNGRRGVVQLNNALWVFGGYIGNKEKINQYISESTSELYTLLLKKVVDFFRTGVSPVSLEDTMEIMAILDAAHRSSESGKEESV